MKAKAKRNVWDPSFLFVSVAFCWGLYVPNMLIEKQMTKKSLPFHHKSER